MVVVGVLHHNANQMVKEVSGGIGRKGGEGEEDYSQPVQGLILQDGERGGGGCKTNTCQIQYHKGPTRKRSSMLLQCRKTLICTAQSHITLYNITHSILFHTFTT